jgi:hypothetical protein
MGPASNERLGANEALYRDANEGIERGLWPGEGDRRVPFRCECAYLDCGETVALTGAEYERVRANPRRFIVTAGHEIPRAESVVERHADYLVVEKFGAAGAVAEQLDARD